ncbi:outer membrane beta-barrel protein [Hymenobacter metallilatus]|uniref:TonB-dependent receptor n=1 Tax=Hymenobacter metallilatus TaxID=2493666 RepID=A0A3R9NJZ3_9BACT|nr:outer membrane beta-barrel protein [Hymenobacter metallilatus]RSK37523.1 TonB-dependent receptor [Hymenobacter metallilatus]
MNTLFHHIGVWRPALVGLLLSLGTGALAQTKLAGRVLDQQKQEALSFATVVVKAAGTDGKIVQSALADEAGRFELRTIDPGSYQLQVLMVGFGTYSQDLQLTSGMPTLDLGTINLQPTPQNLKEVTIVGRRQLLVQKPDRVVMNVEGSVLATGNDAYNILAMAPSVQLTNGRLSFRGKNNVLILLNGKRLPGATLENVLASIPGDQIERIELISNPSAKYDADASGGVIEIYTKRSKELGWNGNLGGNLSQGYRTAGGLNGGLRLSTQKIDFSLTGGYTRRGGLERGYQNRTLYAGLTPVGSFAQDVDFGHKVINEGNVSSSFNYHLNDRNTVGVDVDVLRASLDGSGWVRSTIRKAEGDTYSRSFNDVGLKVDLYNYNLFYKRSLDSLGSNLLLTTNYAQYVSGQRQTFDQFLVTPTDPDGTTSRFRNNAPATYDIYTGAADYTKAWGPATRLESGLKYIYTRNESRQVAESMSDGAWVITTNNPFARLGYREQIVAGYASLSHTVGKWGLQAGLRAEQTNYSVRQGVDSSYFNLFPNLRADYKLSDNYSTSVAYARNINRPSYESLIPYELFIDNYTSRKGNARLRPEYAHSFSWNHLYKGFGLQLAYTQTTNAISSVYLYDAANLRFVLTQNNFRQRHLTSLTLTAPLTPAKWWNMNNTVSVLYQDLSFPSPLDNAVRYVKNKVYYTASTDNTFTLGKGWTAQLNGVYNSPYFSGILDYGAFSNVTVGVKKQLWDKKAALKLDVTDLFYQANIRETSRVVPVVTDGILRNDTRRVRLSFTYKLGKTGLKTKRVQTNGNADQLNRLGI